MGRTRSGTWYGEDAIRIERMLQDVEDSSLAIVRAFTDRHEYLDPVKMDLLVQLKLSVVCETLREQFGFDYDRDTWITYTWIKYNKHGDIIW